MRRLLTTAVLAAGAALPLAAPAAADAALVLGTRDYVSRTDLPRGSEVVDAVDGLAALGFDVTARTNAGWERTQEALAAFLDDAAEADRLVVALSGRFVTDGSRSWYLSADSGLSGLFTLGRGEVSLESVMAVLARNPSRAVLLLGVDPEADAVIDPWLREGVGELDIPQGVTVLQATPRNIANFMADELSVPRGDLSRLVTENNAIRSDGYLPRGFRFMPDAPEPAAEAPLEAPPEADRAAESALWQGAVALDTVDAYRNYLRAYPQGRYAAQAQQGIAVILAEPNRQARLVEEGLGLSRDRRGAIQRSLALLDFDPRGIDGIFGAGTRAAIINWQQQNGFAQTGYLDGEQAARLEAQAARRAAQIEAEAGRQREAQAAADRAFWEESGAGGDPDGLRAYLERFPEGLFAEEAADRLRAVEGEQRERAAAEARDEEREGEGEEREDEAAREAATDAARAAEEALGLNALTARVIEQRLDALGLDAGDVDGEFDRTTRAALRSYQRDRGLPVSGYLNEPTLVRLLADTLGEALQE